MCGQLAEFLLLLFQGLHLVCDLLVLGMDFAEQRCNFLIVRIQIRLLRIDGVDGLHNPLHHRRGQGCRQQHPAQQHDGHRGGKSHQHGQHRILGLGHPEHAAVLQPKGIVNGFFRQCGGIPGSFSHAGIPGLCKFLPVAVVFHLGYIRLTVVDHRSGSCHPGHTLRALETVKIGDSRRLHTPGYACRLLVQLLIGPLVKIAVQHVHNQHGTCQQRQHRHQQHSLENASFHTLLLIL